MSAQPAASPSAGSGPQPVGPQPVGPVPVGPVPVGAEPDGSPVGPASALLLRAAGIDPAFVTNSVDRARYLTAAWAMLLYGVLATTGFTVFLMIAVSGGVWPWVLVGALIAFAIMLYDRMLLSHVPVNLGNLADPDEESLEKPKALGYLVRVLIAVLTALVVTHPLTLKLFEHEIAGQQGGIAAALEADQERAINDKATNDIKPYQVVVNNDQAAVDKANRRVSDLDRQIQIEVKGQGVGDGAGYGSEYLTLLGLYHQAQADQLNAQKALSTDTATLNAQTTAIRAKARDDIAQLKKDPPKAPGGVLNQETALWHVLGHSRPALARYLLIVVLFLVIDVAVLLVKLSSRRSAYDLATAGDTRERLLSTMEIGRAELTGRRNRRQRVLNFQDGTDARRAEREEADDLVIHQAAFYRREANRRQAADEAERLTAENVFRHRQAMERMAGEAAHALYTMKLDLELRSARARAEHERAMRDIGPPLPGPPPAGQTPPNPTPPGPTPPGPPPAGPPPPGSTVPQSPPGPWAPPPGTPSTPRRPLERGDILGGRWLLTHEGLPQGEQAAGRDTTVWQVSDTRGKYSGVLVAKTTPATNRPEDRRLRAQAKADMAVTESDYVVDIIDRRDDGDLLWMIMPYYELGSLRLYMERKAPQRPLRQVLLVADHILDALESQDGRAHGDLKPDNVVVAGRKPLPRSPGLPALDDLDIRVIDWGVSKLWRLAQAQVKRTATGTPGWRAPEQRPDREQTPDPRSDLYSVGCILYWLVAGEEAFASLGKTDENEIERYQRTGGEADPLDELVPDLPHAVSVLVADLLAYEPDDRLRGVALEAVLGEARARVGTALRQVIDNVRATGREIMVGARSGNQGPGGPDSTGRTGMTVPEPMW